MPPSPLNVAAHLARMAAEQPTRVAVYFPRRRVRPEGESEHIAITFAELNADADRLAYALDSIGVQRGVRTVLMVPPSPDFFALTFALFKVAAVPVFIDPGMGLKNLGRCLAEAEPAAFIGVPKAHLARRLFGWGRKTIRITVNVGRRKFFCHYSLRQFREPRLPHHPYRMEELSSDEPAAILFTSGSTGIAKGAEYTHGNFAAQVECLKATYGIEPGEIDLCTFPLFALFGPALGMTCVIPDMDPSRPARIDPRKAVAQIRQFQVTNMFGSPAVLRRLGELSTPLESLRRVISAGAPASAAAIERFAKLLPESAQVFTPYGATEALPIANIGSREILSETRHLTEQGKGVCVGRPVAGMDVSIIPITDEPIPEWSDSLMLPPGEVGEIVVRGPVVTRRYYNRPDATALAKIHDPRTDDILHRMGDIGYIDDRGRLWFCGRKSHRVVTPWGTLFTDMVEPVFNTVSYRTALVGVTRDGVTYPVVCVEPWGPPPPNLKVHPIAWEQIETRLRTLGERFEHTRQIKMFLKHMRPFPVDVRHNSKIFREKLAVWADKKLGARWRPEGLAVEHPGVESRV
ncbi:MAG TPA: fatty acid CoA ligase family protein [Gemmata sp.]|nr:fatty acid CoA ligase family protein [Gemmata sp.]